METGIYRERFLQVAEADAASQASYAYQKERTELHGQSPPPAPAVHQEDDLLARAFDNDSIAPNSLAKLARYEGALERSLDGCVRLLKMFQAARLNPPSPPAPQEYEANPNAAGDSSEDFVETLHFAEDVGQDSRPAEGLQARPSHAPDAEPAPN
jgi:hypothetical protein